MTESVAPEPAPSRKGGLSRKRRVLIWVLVALGALCVAISLFSIWIREVALDSATWTGISSQLLESENVQEVLTAYIVEQIFDSAEVQSSLQEALPEQLAPLAAPISGALRQAADRTVSRLLASERFQDLWQTANQAAHERLVAVLEGKSETVTIEGNQVVLDLGPIVEDVATRVGLPSGATARLSERAGEVVILENDQLQTVQKAVRVLKRISFFLTFVALLAWALAIYLARGRRRETVRAIAASLVFVGVLILFIRGLGGRAIIDAVVKTTSVEPAAQDVWAIFTEVLRDTTVVLILIGVLGLLWAWLTGSGRRAVAFRQFAAPTFRDHPAYVHGALALILLVFLAWGPIGAPRRIFGTLILVALAFVGLELLRRQAVRELPEGVEEEPATGSPAAPA